MAIGNLIFNVVFTNCIREKYNECLTQEPFTTRLQLDVDVAPLKVWMEPENNHIEEGGRVSVSCTATQVRHYDDCTGSGLRILSNIWPKQQNKIFAELQ